MKHTEGLAVEKHDDHWQVNCPHCGELQEYEGYFDSEVIYKCEICHKEFKVTKVWIDDEHYIV